MPCMEVFEQQSADYKAEGPLGQGQDDGRRGRCDWPVVQVRRQGAWCRHLRRVGPGPANLREEGHHRSQPGEGGHGLSAEPLFDLTTSRCGRGSDDDPPLSVAVCVADERVVICACSSSRTPNKNLSASKK